MKSKATDKKIKRVSMVTNRTQLASASDFDATAKSLMLDEDQEACLREATMIKEKTECQYCKAQQLPNGTWISKDVLYYPRFPRSKYVNSKPCPICFQKVMNEINNL